MSIRKQTLWDPKKEQYSGFVNYGQWRSRNPCVWSISFHIGWEHEPSGSVRLVIFWLIKWMPKPKHSWLGWPWKRPD
jgi:hypothetical protein